MECARLSRYGLLAVTGADARDFLHAQLTNDVAHLPADRAAFAGWCTAKGRLLATLLVIPAPDGFLLQLAKDIAPAVAKRLSMFVLRSKVKIADESDAWAQYGVWQPLLGVTWDGGTVSVPVGDRRHLKIGRGLALDCSRAEEDWTLEEIRAGRPLITAATQDKFVPQMVNLETLGGVDFQKGCYPGQEIVARAQYRGEVKRRMQRLPVPPGVELKPGQEFNGGVVVDSAGGEALTVVPV
ncbi:MAG TPA: folate-binding protein [Burkholderiales bacterium]|jgi:tRNA-modifying protein YgfZ|nr:folate-binding protein [Burkholderiales bacterium]